MWGEGLSSTVATTSATSQTSSPGTERQAYGAVFGDRGCGPCGEKEMLEEHCWPDVHGRQAGPTENLLGKPVLPLLRRVCHVSEAHLRDSHLRDVDERLEVAALARRCRCNDRCFKVGRRHTHTEIHASAALQRVRDIDGTRKVT